MVTVVAVKPASSITSVPPSTNTSSVPVVVVMSVEVVKDPPPLMFKALTPSPKSMTPSMKPPVMLIVSPPEPNRISPVISPELFKVKPVVLALTSIAVASPLVMTVSSSSAADVAVIVPSLSMSVNVPDRSWMATTSTPSKVEMARICAESASGSSAEASNSLVMESKLPPASTLIAMTSIFASVTSSSASDPICVARIVPLLVIVDTEPSSPIEIT